MTGADVWRASLDVTCDERNAFYDLLDEPERHRAAKFRQEVDRSRFIAGRGILRSLLGDYLSMAPQEIRLVSGPHGKPALEQSPNERVIHFNVSHCGGVALFAFASREVGIDVQLIKESDDLPGVVAHFFSASERETFENLKDADRTNFFFWTWARKEAYLKAIGEGLNTAPSAIEIGNPPTRNVVRVTTDDTTSIDDRYLIQDLTSIFGHAAAIAVASSENFGDVKLGEWSLDKRWLAARRSSGR